MPDDIKNARSTATIKILTKNRVGKLVYTICNLIEEDDDDDDDDDVASAMVQNR